VIQQVNLYREDVMVRAPRLDARTSLQLLVSLLGALLLVSAGLGTWDWVQAGALERLRAAASEGERGLAELEARQRAHSDSAALDAQIASLESQLAAREHLIELIRASSANRSGFSPQLEGLAHGRVPGMWLDSFHFSAGGRELGMTGRALRPDLVPGFVLELGKQLPFAGAGFAALTLELPEGSAALRFEIHSATPQGDEG
jgi:hypothetical protein